MFVQMEQYLLLLSFGSLKLIKSLTSSTCCASKLVYSLHRMAWKCLDVCSKGIWCRCLMKMCSAPRSDLSRGRVSPALSQSSFPGTPQPFPFEVNHLHDQKAGVPRALGWWVSSSLLFVRSQHRSFPLGLHDEEVWEVQFLVISTRGV